MNKNSTLLDCYVKTLQILFLFVFLGQNEAIGQATFAYADQVISHSHVDNESNAILHNNSFAMLHSYGGVAIGIGSYQGKIELGFPSVIPAQTTSYVRIDFDSDGLNSLLGGGLGGALADLTGTVVLGNHYFNIKAKNNAVDVLSASSSSGFSNENMKLIIDANGYYYIAITPNLPYNRIEIEDATNAVLLGTSNSMKVYHAFYVQNTDACDLSFSTSFDGSGGTLDILGLGGADLKDPENAIDNNINTYSEMSMGVLAVAGTISQTVYFSSLSNTTDQFHVTFKTETPAVLNLGLADGIKIEALRGTNVVYTHDLATLLDLDLLGLLNSGQKVTLHLSPNQSFDRVKVTISSLLQLNVAKELKLYEITRSPAAPTIALASQNLIVCRGLTATLSANTASTNELVWYASANGTTPLAVTPYNGTYTTSVLLAPTTIYVAARRIGCAIDSQRIPILINVTPSTPLDVQPTLVGCGSVNLKDAIINFDGSGATVYSFFDASDNPITAAAAANIQISGIYYIQALNVSIGCISAKESVNVTVNPIPQLAVSPTNYTVNVGDTVTLLSTSNAPIVWYDQNGTALPSNIGGPFSQPGNYTFTVVANNGLCSKSLSVIVTVIGTGCPIATEKVFADTQSSGSIITGGVVNDNNAIDHNLQTHSTIITGLGLLGIGTTWQTLQWNTAIAAGTPVSVKLGSEYSGLTLVGAISVVGTKRNGSGTPIDIGIPQPLSGDLLNLLPGENSFEYSFVPANNSGPQLYDGVRVIVGSVLSVAQNVKVYEAYYTKVANPIVCLTGDVEDIFSGVVDLGVGVLTGTAGVDNEWNSVDNSETTFANMYNGVGVLAAAEMTVKFRTPSQDNDILKIKISKPGTLLTVGLLNGFTIQRYMGTTPVGGLMDANGGLLNAQIIGGGTEVVLVSNSSSPSYDRVRIRFGGAANVLDFLYVHMVKREAKIDVVGSGGDNIIEVCFGDTVSLAPQPCTSYTWYDSEFGGNVIATGLNYTIPSNLSVGTHVFYIQPVRNGCEVLSRTKITIIVGATAPEVTIANILINAATNTVICSATGSVTLTAQLSGTPAVTNPIFHWYSFDGTNQIPIPGQTGSTLVLTGLAPGTYTYFVGVSSNEYCETLLDERAEITFTILPFSVANDIAINDVQQCLNSIVVLQPNSVLTNPVYNWYFTNNTTLPIVNGTFSGITYSIAPNGTLTISGLTTINSPYTYFVSISSDTTCQNLAGTLQDVTVIINNTATPTTSNTTQNFCLVNTPTVADIQVVGTGIIWYDAPTGGTVIPSTTPLVNGMIYYASQTNAITGCESSVLLAVTVLINDGATPTTLDTTQDFCLTSNPTVANIQVNQSGVTWYDAPTNGNVVLPATALIDGMIYYASQIDPINGCVSSVRLAVTVNINDGAPPTTLDTTQDFCLTSNPTVANIQVNESGVTWYDAAINGSIVLPSTALIDGMIYYASQIDPINGCISSVRLAVTVNINDGATPTTNDTTQDFCSSSNPTVANIQVNESGVTWYDAATNGNVVLPSTALIDNMIYYASQTDPANGCVSSIRLAVTVNINDGATPTTLDTTQDFCLVSSPTVANIQVNESGVTWYDAATNGNIVLPSTALIDGMVYYASQIDPINGCVSSVRLAVTVNINDGATPTTLDTTQDFCLTSNPTVANIQVNESGVTWYDAAINGNIVLPSTALIDGMIYYASQIDPINGCLSSVRLAVAVNINDGATPTTNDTTQDFCLLSNPTVANIQVNESGVTWYDAPTNGNVVLPSTALIDNMIYYASQIDPINGCISSVRLAVTVNINEGATPTTNDTTQDFCLSSNPTVANIQVNPTGVIWYDAATNGNVIPPTTALVDDMIYYASQTDPVNGCVSSIRLAVTVNINDGASPTTSNTTQVFCLSSHPTVANIQVVGTGVVWYDAAMGGIVVSSTTPLINGMIYYATQVDPITGCQSSVRLAVTVQINDAATPTTNDLSQEFCSSNNPTLADIQVNETGIIWHDALVGGNVLPSTTLLVNGMIYYASLIDAITGCESSTRLAVTIQFYTSTPAVILGGTPTVCINEPVTYTTTAGMTNYNWAYTSGADVVSGGTPTDNTITISWNQFGNESVSVSYTDIHGCNGNNAATYNVAINTCSNLSLTKTVDNPTPFVDDNVVFTITINNVGSTLFHDVIVNEQIQSGYEFVSYTASNGTYNEVTGIWTIPTLNPNSSATLLITVKVLFDGSHDNVAEIDMSNPEDPDDGNVAGVSTSPLCLTVFNEFTPNEDGSNDFFNIKCAEYYPHNKLEIYNRYGSLVYNTKNYKNTWKGIANVDGTFNGTELPSGTYYYIFDIGDSRGVKSGWLYIMR
ncbi:gliding motility-associated C-terminal domain-containing protein [Flavobacterium sp.]|uniref:Ig-like domain-containing protein n=1 Tax=Flavobacterium sp. TaxID=239 RepID=UPI002619FD1B|nr:gliding motility-associated C-terminal domain-containing protein [Flavobacterium sp.]